MEYGLIGAKLGHSYSKDIHNQIGDYKYELKEIAAEDIDSFMKAHDFKGINVTIPYKQTVIPYLDEIDDAAKEIGAVNTIVNKGGKLFGYNTDFIGLKRLILSQNIELADKTVLILGTGGTSKTARAVAKSLKAKEILIVSRKSGEGVITYEEAASKYKTAQIIINTTPCGMFPNINDFPIDVAAFPKLEGLIDVIYNPLRTQLVLRAQELGIKASGGMYMLVQQAIAAAEYFFDRPLEPSKADEIFNSLLADKQNIILVGMPGCGKSTVGKKLAKLLGKDFFDTDELIQQQENMHPSQIITQWGEEAFRNIESKICEEMAVKTNAVISTGGGAILRKENVIHLKNNGIIFFIDRKLENICPTGDRPLSNSREKLQAVYDKRYAIYSTCCDYKIESDENMNHTIDKIIKLFGGKNEN